MSINAEPGHVLALLIDKGSLDAAADVARWQIRHDAIASPLTVLKLCTLNRGRPDVVLALTLGRVRRAHLEPGRRVGTRPHDYVCVHDDAAILDARDPALCASLAIWLMCNPK